MTADGTVSTEIARRPGRLPGSPKVPGSGRPKGQGNHVHAGTKITTRSLLDKRGPELIARLVHIALGRKMRIGAGPGEPVYYYPSEVSQLKALDLLTRKLLPDLAAETVAITGKNGAPLFGEGIGSAMVARALLLAAQAEKPRVEISDALVEIERAAPTARGIRAADLPLLDGVSATRGKVEELLLGITSEGGHTYVPPTADDGIDADPLNGVAVIDGLEHSWSAGPTPPKLPPLPKTKKQREPGFTETLADGRVAISLEERTSGGRERWSIRDSGGMIHRYADDYSSAKEQALALVVEAKLR